MMHLGSLATLPLNYIFDLSFADCEFWFQYQHLDHNYTHSCMRAHTHNTHTHTHTHIHTHTHTHTHVQTVKLVSEFERIVYISCNPETLLKNLKVSW